MRIVFMGTPEFAVPSLRLLLERGYEIPAVVTAPDKPRGRGQSVSFTAVKEFALERSLRVLQPAVLNDPDLLNEIRSIAPDLIVVVAFRILPPSLYSLAKQGSFNLHASLLPKYRGAAPINWAIIRGESETGVTTFFLQEQVDTGSILLQARVKIGADETAGELHDKLSEVGAEIVVQTVRLIELGKASPRVQDAAGATPAPKIFRDDCRIDWNKSAREVHDLVRGLSPHPAAWTEHRGTMLKLFRTEVVDDQPAQFRPGTAAHVDTNLLHVATRTGIVGVLEVQQEGRRRMTVAEFLRGYRITMGDRFA